MDACKSSSQTPIDVDPAVIGGEGAVNPSASSLTSPPSRGVSRIAARKRAVATSSRRIKAPTIPDDEWERVKEHIVDLYSRQNQTLSEVAKKMKHDRGFDATIRQYELRISKWGVEKKVKTSEMVYISKRQRQRRNEEPEKNRLKFVLRGTPVPEDKIVRFEKRNPDVVRDGTIVNPPIDLRYWTASDSSGPGSSGSEHSSPTQAASPTLSTISSMTTELSKDSTFQGHSPRIEPQMLTLTWNSTFIPHPPEPQPPLEPLGVPHLNLDIRQHLSTLEEQPGHYDTASLNHLQSLGDLLHSQGCYKSAEDVFRKLVAMQRRNHNEESEAVVVALQRLGDTLLSQGRAAEAERILSKTHSLCLRLAHGSQDRTQLRLGCLDSLPRVLSYQGRAEEARALHLEALRVQSESETASVHAEPDPEKLVHLIGLADSCRMTGRLDEATALYTELLKLSQPGPSQREESDNQFPRVQALTGLAITHGLERKFDDAIRYATQALEQVHHRGPEHPNTLARQDDLAILYCQTGRLYEASQLCDEVFERKKRVLGEGHPETILNRQITVNIRLRQGLVNEARILCEQILEKQKMIFGYGHPRIVASMLMLVDILRAQGHDDRALHLFEECVQLRIWILPHHPNTKAMAQTLEAWMSLGGRDGL